MGKREDDKMMKNMTVSDIRRNNRSLIYKLIYSAGKISKQEIASSLNLSLPTVSQKLIQLEENGLIAKEGHFESSVGRRAAAYAICTEARISIGVEIQNREIRIVSVDLKGSVCSSVRSPIEYKNTDGYYKEVAYAVKDFILDRDYLSDQILGVSFTMQGLTSVDGTRISFGKIMGNTGLEITAFSQYLNYPCSFFHDAKCAANAELWFNKDLSDALYISMAHHLGGARILGGQIIMGDHGHGGAAEHVRLVPNGRQCYCGRKGCMDTYCSIDALLEQGEDIDDFFRIMREGNSPEHTARWKEFLETLGTALDSLNSLLDTTIILGGEFAYYLTEDDLSLLNRMAASKSTYDDLDGYIQISSHRKDSVAVGASLYFIRDFIDQI
jgi:predicted NBD/HSP70 family sugar kinase